MDENSPLVEALALWEDLTGVAPPDAKGFWSTAAGMSTWAIRDTYKALKEALDLDPSEVTATLLFSRFLEEYLKESSVSASDMLDNPDKFLPLLTKAKRLRELLATPDIIAARDNFMLGLKSALARVGAGDREDVQKVLADHAFVATLRRDALRSMSKLRIDQFLTGFPEPAETKPVFVRKVHQWWNINALLSTVTATPSGVSLNMVRDQNAYESYFAFAIRNGGNLYVLSDVPQFAHPLQAQMSRRPGRELEARVSRNWFPYELLDMDVDERGDPIPKVHSDSKTIAVYQPNYIPLKEIADLGPAETIWVTMMLDLIVAKFWRAGYQAPQLSYTGEMVKVGPILLEQAKAAGLPVALDQALDMSALQVSDLHTDNCTVRDVGQMAPGYNRWLEDRYASKINPETLNLIGAPGRRMVLENRKGALVEYDPATTKGLHPWNREQIEKTHLPLQQLAVSKFGTPEELEADRRFLARYSYADQIDNLAAEEFRARKDEVLKWYHKRCAANLQQLLRYANNAAIWIDVGVTSIEGFPNDVDWRKKEVTKGQYGDGPQHYYYNILRHFDLREKVTSDNWDTRYAALQGHSLGGEHYVATKSRSGARYDGPSCALTGAKASTSSIFNPTNALEIAALAGCAVKDLPDVLQHVDKREPKRGNMILNRVDPLIWRVKDPWSFGLDLRIRIPLSLRGKAQALKLGKALPVLGDHRVSEEPPQSEGYRSYTMQIGGKQRDW